MKMTKWTWLHGEVLLLLLTNYFEELHGQLSPGVRVLDGF
jgi:hypothetical protein